MFVIVRHGNTFEAGETPRRIGARTDLPLTEKGRDQARALGRYFTARNWHFTCGLVSPLLRTRETAALILAEQSNPPEVKDCDWLREIDHGPDENQPEEIVLSRIGQEALDRWDAQGIAPPGWEVNRESRIAAWQRLFIEPASDDDGLTLIVTSNGAARFGLLADPTLTASFTKHPSLKLPTGGFGLIERDSLGQLSVPIWGQRP